MRLFFLAGLSGMLLFCIGFSTHASPVPYLPDPVIAQLGQGTPTAMFAAQDRNSIFVLTPFGVDELSLPNLVETLRFTSFRLVSELTVVASSPEGDLIAGGTDSGDIVVWRRSDPRSSIAGVDSCEPLSIAAAEVTAIAFSPDGMAIYAGLADGTVWSLDLLAGDALEIAKLSGKVQFVGFSPSGDQVLAVAETAELAVWRPESNDLRTLPFSLNPDEALSCVASAPSSRRMALGTSDGRVLLWEYSGESLPQSLLALEDSIASLDFSPAETTLAIALTSEGRSGGVVDLWNIEQTRSSRVIQSGIYDFHFVRFDADGSHLVTGGRSCPVQTWDTATWTLYSGTREHADDIDSIAFTADGTRIVTPSYDGWVRIWDIATETLTGMKYSDGGSIVALAVSPKADIIAYSGWEIELWNLKTDKVTSIRPGQPDGRISSEADLAFSPNGKLLASAHASSYIGLWNIPSGSKRGWLGGDEEPISTIRFSPDGRLLASAHREGEIHIWDVRRKREISTLAGHSDSVVALAFSPDGNLLASGSRDRTVRLWDMSSYQLITEFDVGRRAYTLAFTPDENNLIMGGSDVEVLDIESGKCIASFSLHWDIFCRCLALSPDGSLLATGHSNGIVLLWDMDELLTR
jgi:WD40 repeat protein